MRRIINVTIDDIWVDLNNLSAVEECVHLLTLMRDEIKCRYATDKQAEMISHTVAWAKPDSSNKV